jgi:import receptor subunit TOM20
MSCILIINGETILVFVKKSVRRLSLMLEKAKKLVEKEIEKEKISKEEEMVAMLERAMDLVKDEVLPPQEDREKYFMDNLQNGEAAFRANPPNIEKAAAHFFNAVRVYPSPMDLLAILQKSVPEEILGLVYAMISTEVQLNQLKA